MITRFCHWWLGLKYGKGQDLWDIYNNGWKDGVDQERMEAETTKHHITLDEEGNEI